MFLLFQILLISFFLTPRFLGGIRVDDIILLTIPILLLIKNTDITVPKNTTSKLYGIFLLLTVISSIYGTLLRGFIVNSTAISLLKIITYYSSYIFAYNIAKKWPERLPTIKKTTSILILLNIIWFIYQISTGKYTTLLGENDASSYGVKMIAEGAAYQVAGVLSISSIMILISIENSKTLTEKILFLFTYALVLLSLFYTQSRINLGGAIIAGYIILTLYFKRGIILNYILLIACLISIPYAIDAIRSLSEYSSRLSFYGVISALQLRANSIWGHVFEGITEHPLLGQGVGSFSLIAESGEVHNYYLKLLYEGGPLYLITFMLFLYKCFKSLRNISTQSLKYLMLSSLIIISIGGLVQDAFSSSKVMIGVMLIIGYATGYKMKPTPTK